MSTSEEENARDSTLDESNVIEDNSSDIDSQQDDVQLENTEELDDIKESECVVDSSDSSLNNQGNAKTSKELKSILALSKEAKLDTNIAHKRKSVNPNVRRASDNNVEGLIDKGSDSEQGKLSSSSNLSIEPSVDSDDEDNKETKDKESPYLKLGKRKRHSISDVSVGGAESEHVKRIKKTNQVIIMHNKQKDPFCWVCHHEIPNVFCETCPRSYHQKCLKHVVSEVNKFLCPECITIMKAENLKQRSPAMQEMSLEHLCGLLKFALKRMQQVAGCEPFINPVSEAEFPEYKTYIVQPMDLTCLEKNIKDNVYGSTQAFESDAKWILHNSVIFNSSQSKLTSVAKAMLKICKQEMAEIENCASCYLNANTKRKTWFVEVCPKPHLLVWAKLKGFPYWPAKAMRTNSSGMVDVRFFGAHDRAWISFKECFLFSLKDPNSNKQKRNDINESIKEVKVYMENLKKVYGQVCYAEYRTKFEPGEEVKYLQQMLPKYTPHFEVKIKQNRKSSSKSSFNSDESSFELNSYQKVESVDSKENENETVEDEEQEEVNGTESFETSSVSSKGSKSSTKSNNTELINDAQIKEDHLNEKRNVNIEVIRRRSDVSTPRKISRHNSDTSNSSRISNLSDKINKVDISENMEILLGSEESANLSNLSSFQESEIVDTKRVPVIQVNLGSIDNAEFTISPSSKSSIADRLMKKLAETPLDTESSNSANIKETVESNNGSFVNSNEIHENRDKRISVKNISELLPNPEISHKNEEPVEINPVNVASQSDSNAEKEVVNEKNVNNKSSESELINNDNPSEKTAQECDSLKNIQTESIISDALSEKSINQESDSSESDKTDKDVTVSSSSDGKDPVVSVTTLGREINEENIIDNLMKNVEAQSLRDKNTKKRKLSSDSNVQDKEIHSQPKKCPKTAITNQTPITNSQISNKESEVISNSILQSRLSNNLSNEKQSQVNPCQVSSDSNRTVDIDPLLITVKTEPTSETEPSDDEYKELKRKYFSALNISEKLPQKQNMPSKPEPKKPLDNLSKTIDEVATNSCSPTMNKEITITRISNRKPDIFVKPLFKIQGTPRARKSFPTSKVRKVISASPKDPLFLETQKKDTFYVSSKKKDYTKVPKSVAVPTLIKSNIIQSKTDNPNVLIINQSSANVIPYSAPIPSNLGNQLQHPLNSVAVTSAHKSTLPNNEVGKLTESQNYIPQSGAAVLSSGCVTNTTSVLSLENSIISSTTLPTLAPLTLPPPATSQSLYTNNVIDLVNDLQPLNSIVSEPLGKAISEVMLRAPPKLKPRPPGPLSTVFDEGLPSSAGSVTSKINSISHRLSDYFRGMLVEFLQDVGGTLNPEGEITKLKQEIERLKHVHTEEILEIKKNICTILKDVQKSTLEDRNRLIEETRAACEVECLKRVEEAKSKQWCAHCSKEAQFYCCWNTSYCDFMCQQAHWSKHMSKCVQNAEKAQQQTSSNLGNKPASQQLVLRPTAPPKGLNKTIVAKPTKVLVNRNMNNKNSYNFTTGSLTLVESSPGSFELLNNGGPISVGGKVISGIGKVKAGNLISVSSAPAVSKISTTGQKTIVISQSNSQATSTPIPKSTSIVCDDSE